MWMTYSLYPAMHTGIYVKTLFMFVRYHWNAYGIDRDDVNTTIQINTYILSKNVKSWR